MDFLRQITRTGHTQLMKERNYTQQSFMLKPIRSESSKTSHMRKERGQMKSDYLSEVQANLEKEREEKLAVKDGLIIVTGRRLMSQSFKS